MIAARPIYRTAHADGTTDPNGRIVLDADAEEGPLTMLYRPGDEIPDELIEPIRSLNGTGQAPLS